MKIHAILKEFSNLDSINKKYIYIIKKGNTYTLIKGYWIKNEIIEITKQYNEINRFEIKIRTKEFHGASFDKIEFKINEDVIIIADPLFFKKEELIKAIQNEFTEKEIKSFLKWIMKKNINQLTRSQLINFIENY